MLDKKIGERIRLARRAHGMTQEQLAELSGFSHKSAINKIELGLNGLSEKKLQAVADALQVSVYYLKTGIQPPDEPSPLKGWTQELAETAARLSKSRRQSLLEFCQFLAALDKRDHDRDILAAENQTAEKQESGVKVVTNAPRMKMLWSTKVEKKQNLDTANFKKEPQTDEETEHAPV